MSTETFENRPGSSARPLLDGNAPAAAPSHVEPASRMDVEKLSALYGTKVIVSDIRLAVEPNSVTALIGPSGCGKSTLLRCLNAMHLTVPNASITGKVLLDGENIYDRGIDPVEVRRRVGMVFQRPNPFP